MSVRRKLGFPVPRPCRGFALVMALGLALFVTALVVLCASLLKNDAATVDRAAAQAEAAAHYGLEVALAQLSSVAADDRVATVRAEILGPVAEPNWLAAWSNGSPAWLVSGANPTPTSASDIKLTSTTRAPLVSNSLGRYAYFIEDCSQKINTTRTDRLDSLNPAFGDDTARLRRLSPPIPSPVASELVTAFSYSVLSNPVAGGLQADLDAPTPPANSLAAQVAAWRDPAQFITARPLIWAEVALSMGIYRGADNTPQLGLAFWADAWNPYTLALPFNAKGIADFRLRLEGPSGVLKFYNSANSLMAMQRLDLSEHTSGAPIDTDLYGTMAPGEVRFITHYRMQPAGPTLEDTASDVEIIFPDGTYNLIFETFDGRLIQKISGIPFDGFTRRVPFASLSVDDLKPSSAHWVYSFKLAEPIDAALATMDPRWPQLPYSPTLYHVKSNPLTAQSNFSSFSAGDVYHDGATQVLFDLPQGSLPSVGALRSMPMQGAPALSLGSAAAGGANELLDTSFFSTLPSSDLIWPPSLAAPLPADSLRLLGQPALSVLRGEAPLHFLRQGGFNINTLSAPAWSAVLPQERYALPLSEAPTVTPVSSAQRQAWANALVARLKARGQPWSSLSQLAAEDILPGDVLCRIASTLVARGDTFRVVVYGEAPHADGRTLIEALVQRLPTATGYTYQLLSVRPLELPTQD